MFSFKSSSDAMGLDMLQPAVHGGGDGGAGLLGILDSFLGAVERGVGPGSSWNPLAGIEALGANVHPLLVHFPIAFLAGFLVCEMAGVALGRPGLRHLAGGMLYFGAAGAVLAATAGLVAESRVPHGQVVHEIMEWHERLGLTVAVLSVILAAWRAWAGPPASTMAEALHLSLAGIVGVCLFFGADLGGLMVYQYGVGVKSLQRAADTSQHEHANPNSSPTTVDSAKSQVAAPMPALEPKQILPEPPKPAPNPEHQHHHHHHHH